jgi:hypothetical protein
VSARQPGRHDRPIESAAIGNIAVPISSKSLPNSHIRLRITADDFSNNALLLERRLRNFSFFWSLSRCDPAGSRSQQVFSVQWLYAGGLHVRTE